MAKLNEKFIVVMLLDGKPCGLALHNEKGWSTPLDVDDVRVFQHRAEAEQHIIDADLVAKYNNKVNADAITADDLEIITLGTASKLGGAYRSLAHG